MHLILTHEQADFDALASLYAAYLLNEGALPVLPRKVNRNVRAFVTLYGSEFPFLDVRDLPDSAIDSVTLVDTQSLVTLKGMGAETTIRVIDHHPRRKGLPDDWQVSIAETGATTTILVEALQQNDGHLTAIQATLLLLGIYEDTGSLTYAGTSSRDVRVAASLIESGADLQIAVDFLNPPLSPEQRVVYEQLVKSAKTHTIHGYRVVVACGEVGEMSEEISTLAHKLRDLLDPDALFVVVSTSEGVRMVARSTTDSIDVSMLAAHFGGGGHERAAAALIRSGPRVRSSSALDRVCKDLLEVLPRYVQPSVTVAQIMSPRPRILSPETPVQEASRLMHHYGYEGYPVVKDNLVVGLLTRRAVDRALAHKLNLTAASLMDAGNVTVYPNDSLQHLQARMTDSGWGQVPVIDLASGNVIGIVTRTDLLKTLAPKPSSAAHPRNLKNKLEKALPAGRLALIRAVAQQAAEQKVALYIVGGFVRDLLLDLPSLDFDFVVEGDAIALARSMASRYGGRVTAHSRFGTAKWLLNSSAMGRFTNGNSEDTNLPSFLDFISARMEFYAHPTALPTIERGSIKLDLHRRDFTINTLALRLEGRHYGEVLDYWGGLNDLNRGLVSVLHSLSFIDDPTRMLRAVRFEQRFGFRIEARTLQLMDEARPLLERLSGDRIRHELNLILDEEKAVPMLARLHELRLLTAIHADLTWDKMVEKGIQTNIEKIPSPEWGKVKSLGRLSFRQALAYLLWFTRLPRGSVQLICSRLRFPETLRCALLASNQLWKDLSVLVDVKPSQIYERLEDIPLLSICAVFLLATPKARKILDTYMTRWRHVTPITTGHDLKARGLPPGPAYQQILNNLRAAWLNGDIATEAQEEALLEKLILSS